MLIGIFDLLNPPTSVVLALFGAWLVGGLLLAGKVGQTCLAGALTGGGVLFLRLLFFMMKP